MKETTQEKSSIWVNYILFQESVLLKELSKLNPRKKFLYLPKGYFIKGDNEVPETEKKEENVEETKKTIE